MEVLLDQLKLFGGNYMLVSAIIAWLAAQIIKIFTGLYQNSNITLRKLLFSTGGMPSSHSASVVALATAAGIHEGLGSPYFAISAVLAIIVMIDATGVRYETGKQARFLNKLASTLGKPEEGKLAFKEFIGHTPFQVLMGALLGFAVAAGLSLVIK